MTSTIICRARPDLSSGWLVLAGGPSAWSVTATHNMLEQAVESVKGQIAHRDWTFTTKALEDAIATYAAEPDELSGLGFNSHATVFLPEGGGVENRMATLHRVPQTGSIVATGLDGRFRPQLLTERVLEWFTAQQWRSFTTPKVAEKHEPVGQQAQRPTHHRELMVRHSWAARAIAPHAFPALRLGPVLPPEDEAKRLARLPQNRAAAKRLRRQAEAVRLRAEAAERARQREAVA